MSHIAYDIRNAAPDNYGRVNFWTKNVGRQNGGFKLAKKRFLQYKEHLVDSPRIQDSKEYGFLLGLEAGFNAIVSQTPAGGDGNHQLHYHIRTYQLRRNMANLFASQLSEVLPEVANQELRDELEELATRLLNAPQEAFGNRNYYIRLLQQQYDIFAGIQESFDQILVRKRQEKGIDCRQTFVE